MQFIYFLIWFNTKSTSLNEIWKWKVSLIHFILLKSRDDSTRHWFGLILKTSPIITVCSVSVLYRPKTPYLKTKRYSSQTSFERCWGFRTSHNELCLGVAFGSEQSTSWLTGTERTWTGFPSTLLLLFAFVHEMKQRERQKCQRKTVRYWDVSLSVWSW